MHNILPTAFMLMGVRQSKKEASGGFADVYVGTYKDMRVALKCPRVYGNIANDEKTQLKQVKSRFALVVCV